MKKVLLLTALLAAFPVASSFADDNLLKNADFEAGPSEAKTYSFKETPGWYNRAMAGSKQAVNARVTEGTLDGSKYSATVNDREDEISSFMQKTEHSIEEGEVFEVSLDWNAGWQWQSQDVLRVVVFARAGNKLGGEVVWQDSVDFEHAPTTWEKATHTFQPAPPEASGKTLFFGFFGVDPQQAGVPGWVRVDNIVLTVKPK